MSRRVEIIVPPELTPELIQRFGEVTLLGGVQLQRSGSVQRAGDVITVQTSNHALHQVARILGDLDIGVRQGTSYSITENVALVERSLAPVLLSESTDSSWEEIHQVLAKESSMTINSLLLLTVAGLLATIGIATGALHIVIAAMVIAPGFEPITRLALGLVAGGSALQRGLADTLKGYLALVAGAIVASLLLLLLGEEPLGGSGSYLQPEVLVDHWTSSSATSLVVSALAAAAGAILVAVNRTVLTAGVMIALALIPSAALVGSGLVAGDLSVAGRALLRWLLDVALVTVGSLLVFWWKRQTVQLRPARE